MGSDEQHWACAECAKKCSDIHGLRSHPSHLSFFKIMLGQFQKSLFIPPKFARLLGNLVGQNIYLKNTNGQHWEVKLSKVDDCLAFQEGWNEFVSCHSIQMAEILVFTYVSTTSFVVQIFGTSGCERSHFCESVDSDMHERRSTDCMRSHKDGRKNDTCQAHCCIGDRVPSKKRKLIETTPCESSPSTLLHCKAVGEFHKRKSHTCESLCLRMDGRKHDNAVHHCTGNEDSARKRKVIRTTSCEILPALKCAANDKEENSNIQQMPSHNMNNISGFQTAIAVDYSEVPWIEVSEAADKGQEESQMAPTDMCANLNMRSVSNDVGKGQQGSQTTSTDVYTNVNVSQVNRPELPCKLRKTDSWKQQETIVTLPSEFDPTKLGTENEVKPMIVEEKSFFCTNSIMSEALCGKKLKGNKNKVPTAKFVAGNTHSLVEMGISPTDCTEVPPISSETNLSKELGCGQLVTALPLSWLSNEKVVPEKDKSTAIKDNTLYKASTAIPVSSQNMPSSMCSEDVVEKMSAYDISSHRFLVDEEGTCYIVQNSIVNPESNSTRISLFNNEMDDAKSKASFAPVAKEISFHRDIISNDLSLTPMVGCRIDGRSNGSAFIDINNVYCALKRHLDPMGSNVAAMPRANDAIAVGDATQQMTKLPQSQESSNTINGSSHGVKQDAVSQANEALKSCLKETVLKAVKTEVMEADDISMPNSTYFRFSLVVNTLSWHELSESLPVKCGKRRLERNVVLLSDPAMRVWPVLYHESFRFTGFLGGWEAFVTANNIQKGDTCHFEASSHKESVLQVQISRASSS